MSRHEKRSILLWLLIAFIIAAGCSNANITSLSEENGSNQVEQLDKGIKPETLEEISTEEQQTKVERPEANKPEQKPSTENINGENKVAQTVEPSSNVTNVNAAKSDQTNVAMSEVEEKHQPTVSLAIVGPQGEDYLILEKTAVEWRDGDTVLEVLKRVTRLEKIHLEYRGRSKNAYIEGIDNLYEFDRGPLSGWVYRVNGVFPSNSAGAYSVEQEDFIEWLYTLDLGQDVGGQMQGAQGK